MKIYYSKEKITMNLMSQIPEILQINSNQILMMKISHQKANDLDNGNIKDISSLYDLIKLKSISNCLRL